MVRHVFGSIFLRQPYKSADHWRILLRAGDGSGKGVYWIYDGEEQCVAAEYCKVNLGSCRLNEICRDESKTVLRVSESITFLIPSNAQKLVDIINDKGMGTSICYMTPGNLRLCRVLEENLLLLPKGQN